MTQHMRYELLFFKQLYHFHIFNFYVYIFDRDNYRDMHNNARTITWHQNLVNKLYKNTKFKLIRQLIKYKFMLLLNIKLNRVRL